MRQQLPRKIKVFKTIDFLERAGNFSQIFCKYLTVFFGTEVYSSDITGKQQTSILWSPNLWFYEPISCRPLLHRSISFSNTVRQSQ
jgi:hypothetical protein